MSKDTSMMKFSWRSAYFSRDMSQIERENALSGNVEESYNNSYKYSIRIKLRMISKFNQFIIVVVVVIIIIKHHTRIYSAPITIIGHRCITESSVLSANTEIQTKKCFESFSEISRISDSTLHVWVPRRRLGVREGTLAELGNRDREKSDDEEDTEDRHVGDRSWRDSRRWKDRPDTSRRRLSAWDSTA